MILDNTLVLITIAGWSLLVLFAIVFIIRNGLRSGYKAAIRSLFSMRFILLFIVPMVIVSALSQALVFIQPQEVGIVISLFNNNGYRDRPLRSGLHWIIPLAEEVTIYPIYWQTYTMSATPVEGNRKGDDSIKARTSDGQEVIIDTSIIFHISPDQAVRVHINWQDRYIEDFVRPVTRGTVRTLVSQYTVDEVNSSKRLDIEKNLSQNIQKLFEDNGFSLDFFVLRNISFSPEYAAAVESKQVALQGKIRKVHEADQVRQEALGQADKIKIQAEAEAEAIRLKARAEADALKMLAESLKLNPDLINLRYVDKLSPGIQVMLVPNNAPYILPMPTLNAARGGQNTDIIPIPSPTPAINITPSPTLTP